MREVVETKRSHAFIDILILQKLGIENNKNNNNKNINIENRSKEKEKAVKEGKEEGREEGKEEYKEDKKEKDENIGEKRYYINFYLITKFENI